MYVCACVCVCVCVCVNSNLITGKGFVVDDVIAIGY